MAEPWMKEKMLVRRVHFGKTSLRCSFSGSISNAAPERRSRRYGLQRSHTAEKIGGACAKMQCRTLAAVQIFSVYDWQRQFFHAGTDLSNFQSTLQKTFYQDLTLASEVIRKIGHVQTRSAWGRSFCSNHPGRQEEQLFPDSPAAGNNRLPLAELGDWLGI